MSPTRKPPGHLYCSQVDEDLDGIADFCIGATADGICVTEDARRIRFILQGPGAVPVAERTGRTPLTAVWKQGIEGKRETRRHPARTRQCTRRVAASRRLSYDPSLNPYAAENFVCEVHDPDNDRSVCLEGRVLNMSTQTVVGTEPTAGGVEKVTDWIWECSYDEATGDLIEPCNLLDETYDNPYSDALAHRGQTRGAYVWMGFSWTPNWTAAGNGNDRYDFYVRRSFDGGITWTTDPKGTGTQHCERDRSLTPSPLLCETIPSGAPEPPRNVSPLPNNKKTVSEPRIVAIPGTIKACVDGDGVAIPCVAEDKQDKEVLFVSYGLATNVGSNDGDEPDEHTNDDDHAKSRDRDDKRPGNDRRDRDDEAEAEGSICVPTDIFYARTTDRGETFEYAAYATSDDDPTDPEVVWDWTALASDKGGLVLQQGEAQLRSSPNGNKFYATWLEEEEAPADD